MPSNHLTLCRPLLLLPSIFPSIRSFPMSQFFASSGQRGFKTPQNMSIWHIDGCKLRHSIKTSNAKKSLQPLLIFLKAGDELPQERCSPTPGGGEHSSCRSRGGGGCFEPKKNQKLLHKLFFLATSLAGS